MSYGWLGVAAGIVALGIATMIGMTIFMAPDLAMNRDNWELARVLIPAMVSVVGWFVTIWWALRHIEISSERNRSLQREVLLSSDKIAALDSVIDSFVFINKEIHRIGRSVNNLKLNIEYRAKGFSNPDLLVLFSESNEAYSALFENLEVLKFRLMRLPYYGVKVDAATDFIDDVIGSFSAGSDWEAYQREAASYLNNPIDESDLFEVVESIGHNCGKLSIAALKAVQDLSDPKSNRNLSI